MSGELPSEFRPEPPEDRIVREGGSLVPDTDLQNLSEGFSLNNPNLPDKLDLDQHSQLVDPSCGPDPEDDQRGVMNAMLKAANKIARRHGRNPGPANLAEAREKLFGPDNSIEENL